MKIVVATAKKTVTCHSRELPGARELMTQIAVNQAINEAEELMLISHLRSHDKVVLSPFITLPSGFVEVTATCDVFIDV